MNGRFFLVIAMWAIDAIAAPAQLYVANPDSGVVSQFDATTGELNHKFVITVGKPKGLAYAGGFLYVTDYNTGTVGKYDATTGATINDRLVIGLTYPLAIAVSGRDLYVSSLTTHGTALVGKYDAATGQEINANFVSGQALAVGLAATGERLYAVVGDIVEVYDGGTGNVINPYFTGRPWSDGGAIALQGNDLWLGSGLPGAGAIGKFAADTGHPAANVTGLLTGGLDRAGAIAVSGDYLYVAFYQKGTVAKYNAYTGEQINPRFITGLEQDISALAAVPTEPSRQPTIGSMKFDVKNGFVDFLVMLATHPSYVPLGVGIIAIVLCLVAAIFVRRILTARAMAAMKVQEDRAIVFPNGLEKVGLSPFLSAPLSGIMLLSDSDHLAWVSLHRGDVIVAVDGYRVSNQEQFDYLRLRSSGPRFIVWRADHYMEVAIRAPGLQFPIDVQTYAAA